MTTFPLPTMLCLRVMTRAEAADWLEIDPKTLRRWQKNGYGPTPFFKNGTALYDALQLEAFAAAQEAARALAQLERADRYLRY